MWKRKKLFSIFISSDIDVYCCRLMVELERVWRRIASNRKDSEIVLVIDFFLFWCVCCDILILNCFSFMSLYFLHYHRKGDNNITSAVVLSFLYNKMDLLSCLVSHKYKSVFFGGSTDLFETHIMSIFACLLR